MVKYEVKEHSFGSPLSLGCESELLYIHNIREVYSFRSVTTRGDYKYVFCLWGNTMEVRVRVIFWGEANLVELHEKCGGRFTTFILLMVPTRPLLFTIVNAPFHSHFFYIYHSTIIYDIQDFKIYSWFKDLTMYGDYLYCLLKKLLVL